MTHRREKGSRTFFLNLLLLFVSLFVSFLAIEGIFRWLLPQELIVPMPAVADRELIYRLPPNTEAYLKGASVRWFHLRTNALGLREREIPFKKSLNTYRIMLLGDSMSMAEGVELEETYIKRYEWLANKEGRCPRIETINAAIRGYGNDQETLLFERIGAKFHPDMVILAFYEGNDLMDNANGGLFQIQGDRLIQTIPDEQNSPKFRYYNKQIRIQHFPGYAFLVSHSHFVNFLRKTYAGYLNRQHITTKFVLPKEAIKQEGIWDLTARILQRWSYDCEQIGAIPVILYIPTVENIGHAKKGGKGVEALHERMKAFAKENGVKRIDPWDEFVQHPHPSSLYLKDGHLSVAGHDLVAKVMGDALMMPQSILTPTDSTP